MRSSMRLLLVVVVCLCVALPLSAQKITGTISGVVTDQVGAVISGADVTATNTGTGAARSTKTGTGGEYAITDLSAGTYDVTIKQANFKEYVGKGVQVFVSSTSTLNASLTVGSATEQMTVEANAVQVETSSGAVGNVIEGNSVRELPLNGRSFAQLTQLMPGVSPASNFDSKHKGLEAGVDFSVNGNSTTGNIFMVDGVNNNDIGSNRTILVYPSIDAIQEFKMLRNSYGPEYGQAMGAIVNIVTRGGTNQFHGGAYYFGRNDALNATDFFNNLNGAKKDVLRRNDWGYNIGGPIVKDKLFFFWSQEWNRELRGKLRSANVPTVAEKGGDFTDLRPGCENVPRDPNNTDTDTNQLLSIADLANHGYIGNQVSNTGTLLAELFPDPNTANPVGCNNWNVSLTAPIYWRQESVRADYKLGKTWSIFGRFTQDHWSQPAPSTLGFWGDDRYPSVESNWIQPGYQATVKVTKLLGNSAVNDFQISYAANRITVSVSDPNNMIDAINTAQQPFFSYDQKFDGRKIGYPVFWGGLGNGANSDNLWTQGPWHNNEELYILKDDFSKVAGAHTFKVGFLASNNKKNELVNCSSCEAPNYWGAQSTLAPNGTTYNGGGSGNGTFDALWNQVYWGWGELQTNPFTLTRWHDYEFYFGDTWKVRRNLTLEYGVRYSLLRNPFAAKDQIASFQLGLYDPSKPASDACNGMLVVPGTNFCEANGFGAGTPGQNRSLKDNNNHQIAPRIGIAWDPRGDGKMSFRAGIGQFYQRERLSNYLYLASNTPFSLNAGGTGDNNHGRTLDVAPDPTQVSIAGSPSFGLDPSNNMPNTWQWNLTFEREVARNSKLEIAYVANRGKNILRYIDGNPVPLDERLNFAINNNNSSRPAGNYGFINYGKWNAASNYNALQVLFRSKIKAFDAQFAYTWSKSLADTDITNSGGASATSLLLDQTNARHDYGPTTINRPHVFTANLVYDTPTLKGQNAFLRTALGNWEMASILSYASGPSWTVNTSNGAANVPGGITGTGTSQNNNRPNRVLQDCRNHGGAADQWWNPAGWTLDNYQLGTLGDSGVGSCSGPGLANTDFSIYKNFKATERVTLQFRFEFFNLFNKAQFRTDSIDTNIQNSSGGVGCNATNTIDVNSPCFGRTINTLAWNYADNGNVNNFGKVRNDKGPREIQYALKINF